MPNNRDFSYTKGPGKLELMASRSGQTNIEKPTTVVPPSSGSSFPQEYTKQDGVLSASFICIISGGTTREKLFLTELINKDTFRNRLDVVFVSSERGQGGLTPNMMLEKYEEIYKEGILTLGTRKVILEEDDRIYMLTDVDHYEHDLEIIIHNDKEPLPIWIISNPCIEIWIYYCYRNDPYNDLREVLNAIPSQRSSTIKTINGTFNNGGGLDPRKAFEHLDDGIVHSKLNFRVKENGIPELLSTQMHLFAEEVLVRLDNEYRVWQLRNQQRKPR